MYNFYMLRNRLIETENFGIFIETKDVSSLPLHLYCYMAYVKDVSGGGSYITSSPRLSTTRLLCKI